jgi:hypothetical protein
MSLIINNKTEIKEIVIKFNYDEEKIKFQDTIVNTVVACNGVIFSDFVMEEILRGHLEDLDTKSNEIITSEQIDIYFKKEEEFEDFKNMLKTHGFYIDEYLKYKTINKVINIGDYKISYSIRMKEYVSDHMPAFATFKENNFIIDTKGITLRNDHALGFLCLRGHKDRSIFTEQAKLYDNIINKKLTLAKEVGNHYTILKKIAKFIENGFSVSSFSFFEKVSKNDKNDKNNKTAFLACCSEDCEEMYRFNKCFYCKECFVTFLKKEMVETITKFETTNGEIKSSKKINRIKCPYREYFFI